MAEIFEDEAALIQSAREGDQVAQGELIDRYSKDVRRVIQTVLNGNESRHGVDDVAQLALLRIIENLDEFRFRPGKSFRSWLLTVAANCARNWLRDGRRWMNRAAPDSLAELASGLSTPSRIFAKAEMIEWIRLEIEKLSPSYRQVVEVLFLRTMSYADACKLLKKSPTAVAGMRFRALKILRQNMLKYTSGY